MMYPNKETIGLKIIISLLLGLLVIMTLASPSQADEVEEFIKALKHKDSSARWKAAQALAGIKDGRAVKPLIGALKDKDYDVRYEAAWALGKINDARAVDALIAALKDENGYVVSGVAWALGEIKDARAVEPLIGLIVARKKNLDERTIMYIEIERAVEALGKTGAQRAVNFLSDALNDKHPFIRYAAAQFLGKTEDSRFVDRLLSALKEKDVSIVAGAYRFFIKRGEMGSEDILIKALDTYGRISMAGDYLNSGNGKLREAAEAYAKRNGIPIVYGGGPSSGPTWGEVR